MPFLLRLQTVLATLLEPFRLLQKRRERIAQEKREEREHQLEIIDTMLERVEKIIEHQKEAAIAQAHANGRLAEGVVTWLEMFKQSAEAQAHLGSETVRPEDEAESERQREIARLAAKGYPVNGSQAEVLQWLLDNEDL